MKQTLLNILCGILCAALLAGAVCIGAVRGWGQERANALLALGLHNSQQALKAQTAVTNMTNELLKKNAETLKMGTIETAKEAERGIIDIETLVETNQSLIDTINEVMAIQRDGHTKRIEAEKQLYQMEGELKRKLLETNMG